MYDYNSPNLRPKLMIHPNVYPAKQDCTCEKALRRFDPLNRVTSDGEFELRIVCRSSAGIAAAIDIYGAGTSNSARHGLDAEVGNLVHQLALSCEFQRIQPLLRPPSLEMYLSWREAGRRDALALPQDIHACEMTTTSDWMWWGRQY